MTFEFAMNYMSRVQKRGSVLGLETVTSLLSLLDNPQDKLKVIHVAGTNGKGSICTFLEAMYRADNKRVGRYISPVIYGYLERFQIDGTWMDEAEFVSVFEPVYEAVTQMEKQGENLPTAFEIETAIAFSYFVEMGVDLVILETGMGGRLDATNVVTHPLCTVFASIGMDHMQVLGGSLEAIASEKAGIMRADCPVVSAPAGETVLSVLKEKYDELHATRKDLHIVDVHDIVIEEESLNGSRFSYRGETYEIPLAGTYQIYNAATAILTKLVLDGSLRKESLSAVTWEGRFETVCKKPLLIRDGAHNTDGVRALKESIQKHFTKEHLIFIIGVLRDKEYGQMMEMLCPLADEVFTVTPQNERGLDAEALSETIRPYCERVTACKNVRDAVSSAKERALSYEDDGERAAIIAWGSLSYMGEITDKQDMN